jgi:hypothetical protein
MYFSSREMMPKLVGLKHSQCGLQVGDITAGERLASFPRSLKSPVFRVWSGVFLPGTPIYISLIRRCQFPRKSVRLLPSSFMTNNPDVCPFIDSFSLLTWRTTIILQSPTWNAKSVSASSRLRQLHEPRLYVQPSCQCAPRV